MFLQSIRHDATYCFIICIIIYTQHHATEFGLNKPLVIGEFRQESGTAQITDMYNYAYYYGYAGGWAWTASDNNQWSLIKKGMAWLKLKNDQQKGGLVRIHL